MKNLYDIIKESVFDEDSIISNMDAEVWLSKQSCDDVMGKVENGKINAEILRVGSSSGDLKFPKSIEFSHIDTLQLYSQTRDYDYSQLPKIDSVTYCAVNQPLASENVFVNVDLKDAPIKSIKYFWADTKKSNYISFPKCQIDEAYIKRVYKCWDFAYEEDEIHFNYDSLKTLNAKKLIIGDLLITNNPKLSKFFFDDIVISKGTPEYDKLDEFMKYNKNLFIVHEGDDIVKQKYHKVAKTNDGFVISKRGTKIR